MTLDNRPVWLLDVDGVLNAVKPGRVWKAAPFHATVTVDVGYRLRWAPGLVKRIRGLHAEGVVEIRWCTSWCPYASAVELALNMPRDLPRALTDGQCEMFGRQLDAAKAGAALGVWDEGRRLVWTDDTAVAAAAGLHDQLTAGGRGLLIAPDSRFGLTPQHMDRIEDFARPAAPVRQAVVLPA